MLYLWFVFVIYHSQIKNHIENYGGYAIGLSKEWGVSKGINPVAYSIKNSLSTKAISNVINIINRECEDEQKKNDIDNLMILCAILFFI